MLESFSNGTPQLDSSCDFQGISFPKMSLFLMTTLPSVIVLGLESFLCNSYSCTFSTTTFAGKEVPHGLKLQHIDRTKSCWWVLSFTSAFQWMRGLSHSLLGFLCGVFFFFKKKKEGGNYDGYLKQTEVKDDFRPGPCVFRVISLYSGAEYVLVSVVMEK